MDAQSLRPHDLLWLGSTASLVLDGGWPAWLAPDVLASAPLVVRREATMDGSVPVGVRGMARSERCKAYLHRPDITRCMTPEMLAARAAVHHGRGPALDALAALAPLLDELGLAWGPSGGVGFFIACGLPVLRADSDLDLLVRAARPLDPGQAALLDGVQGHAKCRVDIQIDTGDGAFAYAEWRRTAGRVLLKTAAGPVLRDDPWQVAA